MHSSTQPYSIENNYLVEPCGLWKLHSLKGAEITSEHYKVHISLDQNKIAEAREVLLPILDRHKIKSFKILPAVLSESHNRSRNVQGKELVIYMQKKDSIEKDPKFWIAVFNEIETTLEKKNIGPNSKFKAQGDKIFPGSHHYIFYRYPNNILGRYVPATTIRENGFTNREGFNLTGKDKMKDWFQELALHNFSVVKGNANTSSSVIFSEFNNQFNEEEKKQCTEIQLKLIQQLSSPLCFPIFFGEDIDNKQISGRQENIAAMFKKAFGSILSQNYISYCKDFHENGALSSTIEKLLKKSLYNAAQYLLLLDKELNNSNPNLLSKTNFGSIAPAIYFHFFMPICKQLKNELKITKSFNITEENIDKLIDKNALIEAIIKCSLRDDKKNQLDYEFPQYVDGISEEKINSLLKELNSNSKEQPKKTHEEKKEVSTVTKETFRQELFPKENGFLTTANIDVVKQTINDIKPRWELIQANEQSKKVLKVNNAFGQQQFLVENNKMITESDNEKTFTMMLHVFKNVHGDKLPRISIPENNPQIKEAWQIALNKVYGNNHRITLHEVIAKNKINTQSDFPSHAIKPGYA